MVRRPKTELVDVIRSVPLFADLSRSELREVAGMSFERVYDAGEVILRQLEDAQHMVAIVSGRAKVTRDGKDITTVSGGDSIGEMSLIDGNRRSASVIAETPVDAVVIYRTTFMKLLDKNPTISRKLLLTQTARLRDADKKLATLG